MFPVDNIEYIPLLEEEEEGFSYFLPDVEGTIAERTYAFLSHITETFNEHPREEDSSESVLETVLSEWHEALLEILPREHNFASSESLR